MTNKPPKATLIVNPHEEVNRGGDKAKKRQTPLHSELAYSHEKVSLDGAEANKVSSATKPQVPSETPPTSTAQERENPLTLVQQFAVDTVKANSLNMKNSMRYIHTSYHTVRWMYLILFVVGVATACFAVGKGLFATNATQAVPSLVFAGLSAASFFSLTLIRPLESLERNTIFSSWIIGLTNTYWTRIALIDDFQKQQEQLKAANDDLASGLSALADKYARAIGKYTDLQNAPPSTSNSIPTSSGSDKAGKDGNSKQ